MSNEVNIGDMIYLTIPKEWIKTYHGLLYMLASVGKQIIDDCSYTCQGSGRNIFTCWNLFQCALAAKALGNSKKAQFFIDYIDKELKLYARHSKIVIPDFSENYPTYMYKLNDDGTYTFYITCKVDGVAYTKEVTVPEVEPYITSTEYSEPVITTFSYRNNVSNENGKANVGALTFTQRVTYGWSNGTYTYDDINGNLGNEGLEVTYDISNATNGANVDEFGNVGANPSTVGTSRTICRITPQITINGENSSNDSVFADVIQDAAVCTFVGGGTTYQKNNVDAEGINFTVVLSKSSGVEINSISDDSEGVSAEIENNSISIEVFENEDTTQGRTMHVTVVTSINTLVITIVQKKADINLGKAYFGTSNTLPTSLGNNSIDLQEGENEIVLSEYGKYQWVAIPSTTTATVLIADTDGDEAEQEDTDSQITGYILYYWQSFAQSDGAIITITI